MAPVTRLEASSSVCVKNVCVDVEVVSTFEDMQRGLQGRESLGDNHGMLFVFKNDDILQFWMKDMKIAIDMIWLDSSDHIVYMAPSVKPCVENPCEVYAPAVKARYVLEIPSGYALKHGFNIGDRFEFKL